MCLDLRWLALPASHASAEAGPKGCAGANDSPSMARAALAGRRHSTVCLDLRWLALPFPSLALGLRRAKGTKSPRRKPGDSGLPSFPRAMRCGVEPGNREPSCGMDGGVAVVPGVPGLPPGASWATSINKDPVRNVSVD